MVDSIKGVFNAQAQIEALKEAGKDGDPAGSFGSVLKESIDRVNRLQHEADKAIQGLAKGEVKSVHEAMIAIEKASISFNMMLQIRNKLLAAYEEMMRMQI